MQLNDFRDILLEADGNITKRFGAGTGNYTVWTPGGIDREISDDSGDDNIQRIYVERFTRLDDDPVVQAIWDALEGAFIPFEYEQDTEIETRYIHHTFTCYVPIN